MQLHSTEFEGVFIIEPDVFEDERGYFFESFQKTKYRFLNPDLHFLQDNEALSSFGVVRGLHYQLPPYGQAKLVRAVTGRILDVIVDIRPASVTYGQHLKIELTETNKKQLFVPKGFAHGYVVLSETAIFSYKCSNYYHPQLEGGIHFDDPVLQIDWELNPEQLIVSNKDQNLPFFGNHRPYE